MNAHRDRAMTLAAVLVRPWRWRAAWRAYGMRTAGAPSGFMPFATGLPVEPARDQVRKLRREVAELRARLDGSEP